MRALALGEGIAVIGWSCRVPGANSIDTLWKLLSDRRCTVTQVPAERFALEHFGHPRKGERGRSYTWAAGVLDDIWGFDPGVFGISPREAQQMDPQQRILLQLAWEALEDAGIRPSDLAGTDVGVFVGGSVSENALPLYSDPSNVESQFATGNALAILANRISYVFDLRGPSITVDTACSSSLVAIHQAIQAIRSGQIETAIVGGINILAAPTAFISFSQASMLSPTGRCRAFSADADGYVRAEGGGVLVLRKLAHAQAAMNQVHGIILASDVNSDGRTNGISLPSRDAQESLLRRIYEQADLSPEHLAFVEAHGTGTPAGDPIEANAIGSVLGRNRTKPLPIGSIKTNIGHLEPASGLAGVIKSMLALNHGVLPPSLHFTAPNSKIDFDALNLSVCQEPLQLANAHKSYAGVNSFGFGGTNAHVVVAPGFKRAANTNQSSPSGQFFAISAESKPALIELARRYRDRIAAQSDAATAAIASAAAHHRDSLSNRLVITTTQQKEVSAALDAFIADAGHNLLNVGESGGKELPVAFIYTGNGSQWNGMGRAAYRNCSAFRSRFDTIDEAFTQLGGWSLREAIFDEKLEKRLEFTNVAQPLIFAIQSAATFALRLRGLRPMAVIGHSVGEVAAVEAAGIIDLHNAVKLIYLRSKHQELIRKSGRMLAVLTEPEIVSSLVARVKGIEIAAYNSPRALTVAGQNAAVAKFMALAKQQGVACLDINLDYPFHNQLMAPIKAPLVRDLKDLAPKIGEIPFISTVTGTILSGERLDASYWWRNVRKPVQFVMAVQALAKLGAQVFLEIGPRGVLTKHISDTLSGKIPHYVTLSAFEQDETDNRNPIEKIIAKALIAGAKVDVETIAGPDPGASVILPSYPWQQKQFRLQATPEAIGWFKGEHHPLSGARYDENTLEWHAFIDTSVLPELADHRLAEQIILPGTGFLEIALSVAHQWLPGKAISLLDFETLAPLDLTGGESREVMTRISSGSRTFEIFSRPRLSQTSWTLHAKGKIMSSDAPPNDVNCPDLPADGKVISGEMLYRIADGSGLHYGPAFRQIENVSFHGKELIRVELNPQAATKSFLLNPVHLDCCCQGLIMLFPGLRAAERGVAYIPVRFDSVTLHQSGRIPQRSIIEIISQNERSIYANFYIFAGDGSVTATLRGVRCQAVPVRRSNALETVAFLESSEPADGSVLERSGLQTTLDDIVDKVNLLSPPETKTSPRSESMQLLDGWAMMVVYEIMSALAEQNIIDLDRLIQSGRVSAPLRSWITMLLSKLTVAKLAQQRNASWTLSQNPSLPSSASIIKELAAKHPERAGELLIAAEITGLAGSLRSKPAANLDAEFCLSKISVDFYDAAAPSVAASSKMLLQVLQQTMEPWPRDRSIRVLQIGIGPLIQELLKWPNASLALTVFEPDRRKCEKAKTSLANIGNVRVIDTLDSSVYDLIVATEALHLLPLTTIVADLRNVLAPSGLLLAIEPQPSLFRELVYGMRMQAQAMQSDQVPTQLPTAKAWSEIISAAGLKENYAEDVRYGDDNGVVLIVKRHKSDGHRQLEGTQKQNIHIVRGLGPAPAKLADALRQHLTFKESRADVQVSDVFDSRSWKEVPNIVIHIISVDSDADNLKALSQACLEMKACAERLGSAPGMLLHIFHGARALPETSLYPVQSGAWAFSRTLANEFQHLDVRRIDIAGDLLASKVAKQIATIIHSQTSETDLQIDATTIHVCRVRRFERPTAVDMRTAPAAKLERGLNSSQRLVWQPAMRKRPKADEIEIEVAVTGLNFRDLMYVLRLLPDDILEDGFSGPTLGLECAGTVVGMGTSVENLKIGDRVVTMAPTAFSTHVIVSRAHVAKIPDRISFEAAATIPAAFSTAYYSLIELAKLKRGEWVLIHAGSGAVGMAAIQIAQRQGARVIATAGAEAKRSFLRALGVHHVLDSRTTQFVEDVRNITGSGVDVVLNSLSGDAMERSLACLTTFGRFIELGKRDFVTNTHIGLRPFRKNLSYFGVDMDQVSASRPEVSRKVFTKIMRGFENGAFKPLPYSVFGSAAVSDAFQLMQKAGHIGKIIVRPPDPRSIHVPGKIFSVDPEGTHFITGGLGGLGLATAKWLADHGARHLVLISRRGVTTDEAKNLISDLSRRGVSVLAESCDVADAKQLEILFNKMQKTMPRLCGIIHSAMVLDDSIVANLTADRIDHVLAPKVRGADNLDRITRNLSLDYFVMFSSVVTLIGNRGQGSYVAANAYLEGLAHRRRKDGLPALAIGWGPITDVGVVARTERMRVDVRKIGGVRGMRAKEALDLMGLALTESADDVSLAVITIAPHEAAFSVDLLPILKSPTYKNLITSQDQSIQGLDSKIDLRSLLATQDFVSVRETVIQVIMGQLARVLLLNKEDVSLVRPLSEMGLDSLMALELIMNLEEILGIQLSPARVAGNMPSMPVTKFADEIIASVGSQPDGEDNSDAVRIVEQHIVNVEPEQIAIVSTMLQAEKQHAGIV